MHVGLEGQHADGHQVADKRKIHLYVYLNFEVRNQKKIINKNAPVE